MTQRRESYLLMVCGTLLIVAATVDWQTWYLILTGVALLWVMFLLIDRGNRSKQ
jgi:hypothetical protein